MRDARAAFAVCAEGQQPPLAIDDIVRALAGLIDKSLLARAEASVTGEPRYQMLETVRAYAALTLEAANERDAAGGPAGELA